MENRDKSATTTNLVLLLTGAITPNSFDTLKLANPEERKKQYIEAIGFYIKYTDYSIVFAENSGESLKDLFSECLNRIEFLTYTSQLIIPDRGKGYKELEIIDYAMRHSHFIAKADAVVKITGRLQVLNINKLIANFQKCLSHNLQLVMCNAYSTNKMDSRCFFYTVDFWRYLNEQGQAIDLRYAFETALWDSVSKYIHAKAGSYKQLTLPLRIKGVSGGFGTRYDMGNFKYLIKIIRHLLRVPSVYKRVMDKYNSKSIIES